MMPVVRIPDPLYKRLQAIAVPLEDTTLTVLEKVLSFYEGAHKPQQAEIGESHRVLDPNAPIDLHHTRVLRAFIGGSEVGRPNWNRLVHAMHEEAFRHGVSQEALLKLTKSNGIKGENNNFGFHYLPEVNISIQGVDANLAWRSVLHLAKELKISLEVWLEWRKKDGAAYPGETAKLVWPPK
jgi:hypothetical protein